MNTKKESNGEENKPASLGGVIVRTVMFSSLPVPFRKMAIESEKINCMINNSFNKLKMRVGKEKAEDLLIQFKNEAFAGCEANHEYIIRKMDSHGL